MKIVLLGSSESKRTEYFKKAAKEEQISLSFYEWNQIEELLQGSEWTRAVMKIDPPSYHTCTLEEMDEKLQKYQDDLQHLERIGVDFLNSPSAISKVLDKRYCKRQLQEADIPVTKMLLEQVDNVEQLITWMEESKVFSVFIKPVCFSGAAGVVAFRLHPHTKKMLAYTSCKIENGILVNTKNLYALEDSKEVMTLINAILALDVMVERWYPKSIFQEKSYDLRVVYQFGHIAHMVVRQSKGPVTNLHLNNQAMDVKELQLEQKLIDEIEFICGRAMELFSGLSMAGIDILIEKNSKKPYIIEMNGQGDLIYQDIYSDNHIYREQVRRMKCKKLI